MNKLALKISSIFVVVCYSILVLYWVINDEGFYGVRFLSIWAIVMMWLITSFFIYLNYEFKHKPEESLNNDKNIKLKLFLGAFLLIPMVSELPDKLSILFYDVDEAYKRAEVYNVEIYGYFTTGTSKSGHETWAYATDVTNDKKGFIMVCNLMVIKECDFGKLKGEHAEIKFSQNNTYPLNDDSVIYAFKSKSLNVGEKEFIGLYKDNKRHISYFLFLIYLPSMFFALVVPRAFK